MSEGESDSQFFSFWPIEKAIPASKAWRIPANAAAFPFGDFLMASHAYCVRCAGPELGSVHIFAGTSFEKVAESLPAFFAAVVEHPNHVHLLRQSAV